MFFPVIQTSAWSGGVPGDRRRCGTAEDPASDQAQLACWETLLLALLESWIQGDLPQPPEALISLLETLIQQGSVGAAWQNLA